MVSVEREIDILESIHRASTPPRQRDLARLAGLSLGMTNAILKRIARKGWLTIRKINNRNIHYVVSAAGLEAISRRSYGYLRRTIQDVVQYKKAIEDVVGEAAAQGRREVLLVGASDLEFLVEHACQRAGMVLRRAECASLLEPAPESMLILSERLRDAGMAPAGAVALWMLLAGREPVA